MLKKQPYYRLLGAFILFIWFVLDKYISLQKKIFDRHIKTITKNKTLKS